MRWPRAYIDKLSLSALGTPGRHLIEPDITPALQGVVEAHLSAMVAIVWIVAPKREHEIALMFRLFERDLCRAGHQPHLKQTKNIV